MRLTWGPTSGFGSDPETNIRLFDQLKRKISNQYLRKFIESSFHMWVQEGSSSTS